MSDFEEHSSSSKLRQKAINLLYLLFIALVFIYVPADFLDSINDAKRSLDQTSKELHDLKISKFNMFESGEMGVSLNNVVDSVRYTNLRKSSDTLYQYIESVKSFLLDETGGLNKYGYPRKSKEFDITDQLMLSSDKAKTLKANILSYKSTVRNYLAPGQEQILDSILVIKENILSSKGAITPWEEFYFKKAPLSVTLMMLSKFQSEVRLVEYLILDRYEREYLQSVFMKNGRENLLRDSMHEDTTLREILQLEATSPSVFLGDQIVVLGFLDGKLVDSARGIDTYVKENGRDVKLNPDKLGRIRYSPPKAGTYEFTARYRNQKVKTFVKVDNPKPAVRKSDKETLYLGIKNRIKVNFGDFALNEVDLSLDQGNSRRIDSVFLVEPDKLGDMTVVVMGQTPGRKVELGRRTFEVKKLPIPYAMLTNRKGGEILDQTLKSTNKLDVASDLFVNENYYYVKAFTLLRLSQDGAVVNKSDKNRGSTFNSTTKRIINDAKKGDIYIFKDITALGSDGETKELQPLVFEVI